MKKTAFLAALLTLAAACMLPALLLLSPQITHSFLYPLGAALIGLAEWKMLCVQERRLRRYALGFGFAFTFLQLAGWRLDAAETLGGGLAPLWLLLSSAALAPVGGWGFVLANRAVERVRAREDAPTRSRRVFRLCLLAILLGWLPIYLAYFPGMFNFDASRQITQLTSGIYDGTLPLLHSVVLGAFYTLGGMLGSYNAGIALYTAVQCLALAGAMAYAASYLYRLRSPRWMWMGMTAVYALLPMHGMMAVSTTKDLFFCAVLLMLFIRLHAMWNQPELWSRPAHWLCIALLTAALCLTRNNGIFAIGAAMVLAFFLLLKKRALLVRVLSAFLAGAVVFAAGTLALNRIYQPPRTGIREWLSVPLSQVARVYDQAAKEGRELAEKEEIEAFIPDVDRYQRHLSDGIKRHTTVGVSNMPQFLSLWGRLFRQYPADFFDAAAYLTKGYWHLDDEVHLDIYAERGDHGYLETKTPEGYGVTRRFLLPDLMDRLDRLFVENEYRNIPILSTVVEPAFWCWFCALAALLACYRRDHAAMMASALLAGLFLSMLFGPCAYIRYAYPMAVCMQGFALTALGKGIDLSPCEGDQNGKTESKLHFCSR